MLTNQSNRTFHVTVLLKVASIRIATKLGVGLDMWMKNVHNYEK